MWCHPKVPDPCKSNIQCSNSNGAVELEQWLTASLILETGSCRLTVTDSKFGQVAFLQGIVN